MIQAHGYIRVSTEQQDQSPEVQRGVLQRYAATKGYHLISVQMDVGVSGSVPAEDRPGLCGLLGTLQPGQVVLVATLDRLARSVVITSVIHQMIQDKQATIEYADGAGNGSSPEEEMMRNMLAAFAQYERAKIRLRTKMAMRALAVAGKRVGSLPYGKMTGQNGYLIDNPLEQAAIARIMQMYAAGYSYGKIATCLTNEGVPPRGKEWHRTTIRRIINNRATSGPKG